ncbi:MAG: SDR family NAD(P)-dependent oxidoreductase [Actinomycetota bacterium]
MDSFTNRTAVVTGGGDGMGRELVRQLASEGCHVALCDIFADTAAETKALAEADAPAGTRITTHTCDVSDEAQILAFRDEVVAAHPGGVHLLFNNAGIGGGGSVVDIERDQWQRTFDVCWGGVFHTTLAFLPEMMKVDDAHLVNTSSVNGFWASIGPDRPHSAYSAAKFAVKGFSEALITDLKMNAPHIGVSVVMPGHIGTGIAGNSFQVHAGGAEPDPEVTELSNAFRNNAPTTAAQAATVILDAVKAKQWRILVGDDAVVLDQAVRDAPEEAYDLDFPLRLSGHLANLLNTVNE